MDKRQEFLKEVEPLSREDVQWVKDLANKKLFNNYMSLIEHKAHNSPTLEAREAAIKTNEFLSELYADWYNNFASQKFGFFARHKFAEFFEDKRFDPSTKEHKEYLDKCAYSKYQVMLNKIKTEYPVVYYANLKSFPYIDQDLSFIHFDTRKENRFEAKTECRLYLNVKIKNVLAITKSVLSECEKQNLPLMFKISTVDERNETMVFYTDYEHASNVVDMLEKIKNTMPERFAGAQDIPSYMGKVRGFLGFGEEPNAKNASYATVRARAIKLLAEKAGGFEKLDVPNLDADIKYMMLNYSTLQELTKQGFNLSEIGSKSSAAQRY